MLYFSFTKRCATTVLILLYVFVFSSVNGQKKLPVNPFVPSLAGCPNSLVGCSLFANPQNYTCASSFTYAAATNDNECLTGPTGVNYGCLNTVRNQMWFVITAQTTGTLTFSFNSPTSYDIDGAIWGAIPNNDLANACSSTLNTPISCDFSGSSIISMSINAVAGQKYVMMIANYSNYSTNVNITQPSGGTVSYCKVNATTCVAPTVTVSGNSTINQGQSANISLAFTGAAPYTYTLSDGQTGTTSTNPLTISVAPLSNTTYTVTSISNACGAGTSSGSGVVTVSRTVQLVSCFPLNNNAIDQIGGNNGGVNINGGSASYVSNRNASATSALSISNGAYVQFPTTNLLNNTFTHSLWVSPASLPANGNFNYILSIGGIGQSQELYLENEAGVVKWVFRSSTTSGNVDVKYPANITLGQWYHVAIVRTTNALQMYVNGILVQSSPASGLSSTYSSPSIGRLGTQSSGLVNFFNGKIDDVRLFKSGLNGLEISSLYSSTLDCPPIVGVPLISMTNITNNTLCRNQLEAVNFQQSEVTAGSTYTVQLSDASGSFTSPTAIGTGTVPPIQVSIPTTVTTSGTAGYLIRIINGTTISFNTLPVTILPTATGVISGTATINEGQSTNLTINFTGTSPWTYSISNGVSSTTYSSTNSTATQGVSPLVTTTYTLSSVKDNTCGTGTGSGSAVITVNSNLQLLACYPFNGNAQDSKGSNHGTVNGATLTTDRFGNTNSAYSFNGASNYIAIPGASLAPAEYTYAAWVNTNTLNDYSQTILSIGWLGADQVLALSNTTGTTANWNFASYIYQAALPIPQILSTIGVTANTWHFVVATRTLNELKLYIDGQIVGTTSSTGVPPLYATPIAGAIGARSRADIQFFNGKIDDVKIYNGALNQAQITGIYLAEQQCPIVETGGLITATSLSTTTSCPSGTVNVNVITNNIIASAATPLSVELSNSLGSFASPIQIGTGTTNNILCTIPANITAGNYKIRVIFGTSPNQVISVNTLPLIINPAPTATISGTASIITGSTASLTVNFTGAGPWTYRLSGTTTDIVTSVSPATISVSPTITTTYTLISVSNTCGVGTISGSAVVTVNIIPQLLACYKFDGNAQDSKGNHSGTISGATLTTDRFGKPNSAYNFDGNSYIQLANPDDFKNNTFTYSAWVNANDLPGLEVARTILSVGNDAGDQHFRLFNSNVTSGPAWNFNSYTGYGVSTPLLLSYTSVLANTWTHVVVVRSLSGRKIYINGILSISDAGLSSPYYSTPALATIGSRYNQIQKFYGKIDDIKIYNGTLSDEEVLLLYNEEQGECSSPCSGMIYSLGSGNWSTPATWSCGRVPDLTDKVLIKAGHTITISTNNAKAKKLVDNGRVTFANSTSKLSFGNATMQNLVYEIQPNATVGKDALVSSYLSNGNHETVNYMGPYAGTQGGTNNINRTFISFDLSTIPTNAIVDSAYLTIFYSQAIVDILYQASTYFDGHVGDTRFWIQKVTQSWSENTITWNNQPTTSTNNQVSIPVHTSKTQNYKLNVKTFVQDMLTTPSSNYGFMLKLQNETPYTLVALASSDEVNPTIRPKIQVCYHLP